MPNLQTLNLSACELDDSVFGCLHDTSVTLGALRVFSQLRRLYLWAVSDLSNSTMHNLYGHVPLLEVLDLRMCGDIDGGYGYGPGDLEGICLLASSCPLLSDLRLKGLTRVDDGALEKLSMFCPLLTLLDLSGSRCTVAGITALASACPALESLHLAGCKHVGNAGVASLAAGCPALRTLNLQGCSMVGDAAAHALAARCPLLHTVSFQCCATLSDSGFMEICRRCALRHITLKLTAVTSEAIEAMRAHGATASEAARRGGALRVVDFTVRE